MLYPPPNLLCIKMNVFFKIKVHVLYIVSVSGVAISYMNAIGVQGIGLVFRGIGRGA